MRFAPEANHGGNAGLEIARDLLEPVKEKFPNLSYADIYTFAGKASIELMDGPVNTHPPFVRTVTGSPLRSHSHGLSPSSVEPRASHATRYARHNRSTRVPSTSSCIICAVGFL
jgi:hypothetical protein